MGIGATPASELELEVARVYESYSDELLAYGASFSDGPETALDAVQEAFLRYIAERSHGRVVENPRAWLYRVLRNHLLDRLGTAAYRREISGEILPEVYDPRLDPETLLRHAQRAGEVAACLTPRELECLRLRAEGLSYNEIAESLQIQQGTVSALLTRVHKKLRGPDGEAAPGTREALFYLFREGDGYSH